MMTLRLGPRDNQRGVIHMATFVGPIARWRSRCPQIELAMPENELGPSEWWQSPQHGGGPGGRRVTLGTEPPEGVPVCRRCITVWKRQVEYVELWLIERGAL